MHAKISVMADAFEKFLKSLGIDVLKGDNEIRADQMIPVSIEQAILKKRLLCGILELELRLKPLVLR